MEPEPMDTERSKRAFFHPADSSSSVSRRRLAIEEDQVVYMFISLATGPISHALYAVRVPKLGVSAPTLVRCNQVDKNVYPVCELPRADYAEIMCCQKLGSKLYILGGFVEEDEEFYPDLEYPEKVYSVDLSSISPSSENIDPKNLLVECSSMSSGKPECRAYVDGNFLYAISPCLWDDTDITRFERLNPHDGVWSPLPTPPFNCNIRSDAMVKSKIIFGTADANLYCFDVEKLTWTSIGMYVRGLSFKGHSTVLDDMLYSFTYTTLFAFGPTTDEQIDNKVVGLFKEAGVVSMPLCDTILDHFPTTPSVYLDYWGNRLFCLGIVGTLKGAEGNQYDRYSGKGHMSVILFEVPEQNFEPPTETGRLPTFRANLLHSTNYIFRSRNGARADLPYLLGCFSNSTGIA